MLKDKKNCCTDKNAPSPLLTLAIDFDTMLQTSPNIMATSYLARSACYILRFQRKQQRSLTYADINV